MDRSQQDRSILGSPEWTFVAIRWELLVGRDALAGTGMSTNRDYFTKVTLGTIIYYYVALLII